MIAVLVGDPQEGVDHLVEQGVLQIRSRTELQEGLGEADLAPTAWTVMADSRTPG